jgi:hypothetical protein
MIYFNIMGTVTFERDLGWKKLKRELRHLKGSHTQVGIFGNGGQPEDNLAARATVHEFGTKNGDIPARPFNRRAWSRHKDKVISLMTKGYNKILKTKGREKVKEVLSDVGAEFEGRVKQTLTDGGFIPLKPATVEKKNSSTPLIDEGDMRRAITHKEVIK